MFYFPISVFRLPLFLLRTLDNILSPQTVRAGRGVEPTIFIAFGDVAG